MGTTANTSILSPTIIAREALAHLVNNMVMGNIVHRIYENEFVKIGASLRVRKPVKFGITTGATISLQAVNEEYVTITIDTQAQIAWEFNSQELTLQIEQYAARYIRPAVIQIANKVDNDGTGQYVHIFNAAGTAGTTPSTFEDLGDVATILDNEAVPVNDRRLVLTPKSHWKLADGLKGLFLPQKVGPIVQKGYLGTVAGMSIYMDQNIRYHTAGLFGSAPKVKTVTVNEQATIDVDNTADAVVLTAGDIFTIATVNKVNPVSGTSVEELKQFVSTTEVTGSGNEITIIQKPTIFYAASKLLEPRLNMSALPDDEDSLTQLGSHWANLCFQKDTFALCMVPLVMPDGVSFAAQENFNGANIRVIKDYDITYDKEVIRLDSLYGWKTIYPEMGARLLG
ncbi:hypothetical protein LCGC14_1340550 [marine sediment metagenome]|uniref:Capsid protein n=1 Tax=marine sediment metagenome TaxID=412755 RepID=A0A0F9MUS4_9ZZZZ